MTIMIMVMMLQTRGVVTACTHSEGESLCGEEKMRLGGSVHPQNGDIGGCKASRVATEDYTIDQVRTLGGPDHISCWATSS